MKMFYNNNTHNIDYAPSALTVFPIDTTVFRKAAFNLYYNVTGFTPATILWNSGSAYTLSCNTCASPQASMLDSGSNQSATDQPVWLCFKWANLCAYFSARYDSGIIVGRLLR